MYQKTIDLKHAPKSTKIAFVFLIIAFIVFVNYSMKNEAYDYSLEQLRQHDEVLFYLGSPIDAGYLISGEVGSQETELNYSISGPLNNADVYLYAKVVNGFWVIQDLEVVVDGINKVIDASSTQ